MPLGPSCQKVVLFLPLSVPLCLLFTKFTAKMCALVIDPYKMPSKHLIKYFLWLTVSFSFFPTFL